MALCMRGEVGMWTGVAPSPPSPRPLARPPLHERGEGAWICSAPCDAGAHLHSREAAAAAQAEAEAGAEAGAGAGAGAEAGAEAGALMTRSLASVTAPAAAAAAVVTAVGMSHRSAGGAEGGARRGARRGDTRRRRQRGARTAHARACKAPRPARMTAAAPVTATLARVTCPSMAP
jgi:hypothetical protein